MALLQRRQHNMASIAKSFEIAGAKCGMSGKTLIVPSVSNLRMTQKPDYSNSQVEHTRSACLGRNSESWPSTQVMDPNILSLGGCTFGRLGLVGFGWAGLDLWSGLVWSGTPRFVCVKFIYGPKIPKKGPKTESLRKNLQKTKDAKGGNISIGRQGLIRFAQHIGSSSESRCQGI